MPEVKLICDYCDARWKAYIYNGQEAPNCPKCADNSKVRMLKFADTDPFGYNKGKEGEK